jgi:hypothetical protein
LIGSVGKDPEMRSTQDGKRIASFSLATSESWRDTANPFNRNALTLRLIADLLERPIWDDVGRVHSGQRLVG